jgi:hypothetical protein
MRKTINIKDAGVERKSLFTLHSSLFTITGVECKSLFTLHSTLFTLKRRALFTIALILFGMASVSAQHYIGLKGGYGGAQGRIRTVYGKRDGRLDWNRYTGGLMWRYYSSKQVVGGLQVELEYQMRGYSAYYHISDFGTENIGATAIVSDTTSYRIKTRTVSSVTLPLIWQPHVYFADRHIRLFVSAGVTFSYNLGLGDSQSYTDYKATRIEDPSAERGYRFEQTVTVGETTPYKMNRVRDIRWNYGWLGGIGVGVLFDRWEIFAEGRYYYGMGDIMRTYSKNQLNNPESVIRSELDNIYITVGVFFRLGKGGILSPRGWQRPAPVSNDDFKNIKLPY